MTIVNLFFESEIGLDMNIFLNKYKEVLRDKHILYVISTNLVSDQTQGKTRTSSAPVFKIGMSEKGFSRLTFYQHILGIQSKMDMNAGVKVHYVQVFPKKLKANALSLVRNVETFLKRETKVFRVSGRGTEVLKIPYGELSRIVKSDKVQKPDIEDLEMRGSSQRILNDKVLIRQKTTEGGGRRIEATEELDRSQKREIQKIISK